MCGIVGYIGGGQAAPILLEGLKRLEYRGYDSAGIAVMDADGRLRVRKAKGYLEELVKLTHGGADLPGSVGIGHTRWATHGEPSDLNSHPHLSQSGRVAVVHNGIIENYVEIKEFLTSKGVRFVSDTDTEVVAQLLDYNYERCGDMFKAVFGTLRTLEGAYALGIISSLLPNRFIAARKDAPLLLGYGEGCSFVASDATAIIRHTREVSYMDDGEVAVVSAEGFKVFDEFGMPVEKERHTIEWDADSVEKGGYEHFMFKEIMEQPEAVAKTISPRLREGRIDFGELGLEEDFIRSVNRIYIVACGSSYHVGMVGKYSLEKLLRIPVETCLASEFRYSEPIVDEKTLVIVISQSGETLDSMKALLKAKSLGGRVLSIVNRVGSAIARGSDHVLYTWAGPEIAVATTKAYSTQLVLLNMLGVYLARELGRITEEEYDAFVSELRLLPDKLRRVLEDTEKIKFLASRCFNHDSVFFIGRNLDYALGLEGSLKLKEISYIHSEAYASGELKHGTISLIVKGTLVVALGTFLPLLDKTVSNIVEVKARGADVLALTTESAADELKKVVDNVLSVPDAHPLLQPLLGVVPLQLFAYYVALHRGCNIDKPRNLAKSVTVE